VQQSGGVAAPALGLLAGLVGIGAAFTGLCAVLGVASIAVVLGARKL
jgi:hypothetical protein